MAIIVTYVERNRKYFSMIWYLCNESELNDFKIIRYGNEYLRDEEVFEYLTDLELQPTITYFERVLFKRFDPGFQEF